jgi:hypothetical protein
VLGIDLSKCSEYGPTIRFERCILGGFVELPKVIGAPQEIAATIRFTDCLASTRGGMLTHERRRPLDYAWDASAQTGSDTPRTIHAAGPPTQGTWRVGDQALNRQPKTGSYVGWVCVTGGSPGEWRPFGLIA